jgi:hypothetical protein
MKYLIVFAILLTACTTSSAEPTSPKKGAPGDDVGALSCQCTADYYTIGCPANEFDGDFDCVCDGEDNCDGTPNCDRANADGDAFGDACDEFPGTPDPEALCASQDTRLDALEASDPSATIAALQADVALLTAALVEIRTKYPAHYHGLLGLNGEPVGVGGDLTYSLPGD